MTHQMSLIEDLCTASQNGDLDCVKEMLSTNAKLSNQSHPTSKRKPIHYAARAGHAEIVHELLDSEADPFGSVHAYGPDTQPLTLAKDRGHQNVVDTIEQWLNQTRGTTEKGQTLVSAIKRQNVDQIEAMLDASPATIHETDQNGNTALHEAIRANKPEIVRLLLDLGAEVDRANSQGQKPIHVALHKGPHSRPDGVMASILISAGAEVDIWVAAVTGDLNAVQDWLKTDLKLANHHNGATLSPKGAAFPITVAAKENYKDIVVHLFAAGADPNTSIMTNDGPSEYPDGFNEIGAPLYCAIGNGHLDMAHLLLDHGAQADAPPMYAAPAPFDLACKTNDTKLINRMLIAGARPLVGTLINQKNYFALGELIDRLDAPPSPYYIRREGKDNPLGRILLNAVRSANLEVTQMCLNKGIETEVLNGLLYQCMHHAQGSRPYIDVFNALLDHGADPNCQGPEGTTPLHFVATISRGNTAEERDEFAQSLLDRGADLHAVDNEMCSTPLGWATRVGVRGLTRFLLAQGADPNQPQDPEWAKPMSWAIQKGHDEVVEILNEHNARQ